MLGAQEGQDYGRYRDEMSDYATELERLQNQYNAERDYDYGMWADGRDFGYGQYIDDRNYQYQTERDKVADEQWQKEYDEALRQFNFKNKLGEFAKKKSSSSGGSSSSSKKTPIKSPTVDTPVVEDNGGGTEGFTGSTYSEAVAYMKDKGVSGASASGIKTESEFKRSSSSKEYNSYKEYLSYSVDKKIATK